MNSTPMIINLRNDALPFQLRRARPIPLSWRDQVKSELDGMYKKGIIAPMGSEPSECCHPLIVTLKANGKIWICVDFRNHNHHVERSIHPTTTPAEAISHVSTSRFFRMADAMQRFLANPPQGNQPAHYSLHHTMG